jgi:dTDP-4-amino-4,6-dideoxygalactose transaminase
LKGASGRDLDSQRVPLLDLKAQYRQIEADVMRAVSAVCASQRFILGPNVEALEAELADYCGARYAVGVSSGTDALLAALMALDIGPGDEVITTPFSFFATAGSIVRVGARPLFCDIEPDTFAISIEALRTLVEQRCQWREGRLENPDSGGIVKCIMPVHLFGQMADMDAILEVAQRAGLAVIEDAAQAIGARDAGGRQAGSGGDIGCFSFFPSKNLGAFGDGGLCTTNDAVIAERLKALRMHGETSRYHHALVGGNFRLDELQAAVLRVKLQHLETWTAGRQTRAGVYAERLAAAPLDGILRLPIIREGFHHVFNQYVIRASRRDALMERLMAAGIGSAIYYPLPLHQQPCFEFLGWGSAEFPEASKAAREVLALPVFPELTLAQQKRVIDTIRDFFCQDRGPFAETSSSSRTETTRPL